MTTLRSMLIVAAAFAATGCSKKDDTKASPKSGLAWTPVGYSDMSATCKKALACCEEVAKTNGAKTAEDFNGKCSGPALWKDDGCEMDLKARIAGFEADGKPVPDACK